MLLDGVVEGGLELDVLRVDVGTGLEQKLAKRDGLDRVDQAGAAVVVGSVKREWYYEENLQKLYHN